MTNSIYTVHNSEFPFKMTLEAKKKKKIYIYGVKLDIKSIKAIGTLPRGMPLEENPTN